MLLILSAQPVTEEIAQQVGPLPPSFLPLGGQRLFSIQADLARGEPCVMTLPADFAIPGPDRRALEAAGIAILPQPPGMRLTQALGDALARLHSTRLRPDGPLRILYGDTLVQMDEATLHAPDMVAVQQSSAHYAWAFAEATATGVAFSDSPPSDTPSIVCGYYSFSDPALLARACREPTIVGALQHYTDHRPLSLCTANSWLDFGPLPLYLRSRKDVLVKRVFNELDYEDDLLIKHSSDTAKMQAEAHWFEHLPAPLRLHVPRYHGRTERDGRAGYGIEYLYAPLVSDLAVFATLPRAAWGQILQAAFDLLAKFQRVRPPDDAPESAPDFADRFFRGIVVDKTRTRLRDWCAQSGIAPDARITLNGVAHPPLADLAEQLIAGLPPTTPDQIRFWHGDFYFGNMFYDDTARRILCIDPRGQLAPGQPCLWGDLRYDLAKLAHSIAGQYDRILLGRSTLEISAADPLDWTFAVEAPLPSDSLEPMLFAHARTCGVAPGELLALTALLFLSMLPLHGEDPARQKHLLAMALILATRAGQAT